MNAKGKRVVVLVEHQYEDLELWYPVLRLREAQADVTIVGPEGGTVYKSKHGYEAKSQKGISDLNAQEVEGLIIPGGYAPDRMRTHPKMVRLVRDVFEQHKTVAAICHGGWMLASAGILKGKRVTSFAAIKDDLINAGAHWVDEEVVRDGTLITSRKPDDLPLFMAAILESLASHKGRG